MIHVVQSVHAEFYTEQLDQMFKQRATVFKEKLGWDVYVDGEGREQDRYDGLNPTYLLWIDDNSGKVLGSLRLMPTTGPTLLGDVFQDTLPDGFDFESPLVWECTRFCVEESLFKGRSDGLTVSRVASEMLFAIGEVGVGAGIKTIVGNFVPAMLRVYKRAGCKLDVLGKSGANSVPVCLGAFEVADHILENMRRVLGISGSILADQPRRKESTLPMMIAA